MKTYKHKKSGMIAVQMEANYKVEAAEIPACIIENSGDWEEVVEQHEYVECITHSLTKVTFGKIYHTWDNFVIDDNGTSIYLWRIKTDFKPSTKEAFEKQNRKPILVTEDGIDIYENDLYFYVEDGKIYTQVAFPHCVNSNNKQFSTVEAAKDYIKQKKTPILITEDGHFIYSDNDFVYAVSLHDYEITPTNARFAVSSYKNHKFFHSREEATYYIKQKTTPILITEDGVEVFVLSKMKLYGVSLTSNEQDKAIIYKYVNGMSTFSSNRKWFADEGKAKDYLIKNTKLFSIEDVKGKCLIDLIISAREKLKLA